jgi:hypothetical protein
MHMHFRRSIVLLLLLLVGLPACSRPGESGSEAAVEKTAGPDWGPQDDSLTPPYAPKDPGGCAGGSGMTILMDGRHCVDDAFLAGGDQPAVAVRLTEPDGRIGILLLDMGSEPTALENNLAVWFEQHGLTAPLDQAGVLEALFFSHGHTFGGLLSPPSVFFWKPLESLRIAWRFFGEIEIQGAVLPALCHAMRQVPMTGVARKVCADSPGVAPGLAPLLYANGTPSQRAWTFTYAFLEPQGDPPFEPVETVFVFRSGAGYVVYSVCSHAQDLGGRGHLPRRLHVVEQIQDEIDAGRLPPGVLHTLVTGSCGMQHALSIVRGREEPTPEVEAAAWRSGLRALAERTGLQRVYLTHCSLSSFRHVWPIFTEVFGAGVQRAVPGSCIPLEPSP